MKRAVPAVVIAGALLRAGAAAALGAPAWHGPTPIGPTAGTSLACAALAARGEALVAWIIPAAPADRAARWRVRVRVRHGVRAPWQRPITIAVVRARMVSPPVVALNARGDALVAWRPQGRAVQLAARSGRSGRWRVAALPSGPALAGDPGVVAFAGARVALAPSGAAAMVWATQERSGGAIGPGAMPGRYVVRGARRASRGGSWQPSPALPLEPVADLGWTVLQPRLAVDARGDAAALWIALAPQSAPTPLAQGAIRAARRTGDGPWSAPATLADPAGPGDVALAANGRAAAAWQGRAGGPEPPPPLGIALGEPGATGWSALQAGPDSGRQPRVAVNARGDVLVGWGSPLVPGEPASERFVAHAAIRPAGGSWGQIGTFPATGQTAFADLGPALDETGRGYVAWDTGSVTVEARANAAAGSAAGWPAGGRLSAPGSGARVVAGPDGTALALLTSPRSLLAAASYDGRPRP